MPNDSRPTLPTPRIARPLALLALAGLLALSTGCGKPKSESPWPSAPRARSGTLVELDYLKRQPVGAPAEGHPWVTHVNTADLDKDGRLDILATECQLNAVLWLRQTGYRKFEEIVLAAELPAPVHVEAEDMDDDGDLDLLVSCMGQVFPNNDKIGSVVILENDGQQNFTRRDIITNIARVVDIRAADFDGDGLKDMVVGQFGYDQGEIRWMRNRGNWQFDSEILLGLSGTVNVCVDDVNQDGRPDFLALVSQDWEEIYYFENQGGGRFGKKVISGSTNKDFGSSGLVLCDLNKDGRNDLIYTNGDGFDYAAPGPRPWHGIQWLENTGGGNFRNHRIADMAGAYGPSGVDIDQDGDMDIVAVSCFNHWDKPGAISFMLFRNDGAMNFTPVVLAYEPTHLLITAVGDFENDGKPGIVTGGFHAYPPYDHISRISIWRR